MRSAKEFRRSRWPPEQPPSVYPLLVQARRVHELHPHLEAQVGLVLRGQLIEGVLVDVVPPDVQVDCDALEEVDPQDPGAPFCPN